MDDDWGYPYLGNHQVDTSSVKGSSLPRIPGWFIFRSKIDIIWVNLITTSLRPHWKSLVNKGNHLQMVCISFHGDFLQIIINIRYTKLQSLFIFDWIPFNVTFNDLRELRGVLPLSQTEV